MDVSRRPVAENHHRSIGVGATYFVLAALAHLGTFAGAAMASGWPARIAFAMLNGVALTMLFLVGREASHGRLTPNAWVNRRLARLALLPGLHATRAWHHSDNVLHRTWTNVRGMDPICCPLTFEEFHALTPVQQGLQRFYRSWVGLLPMYVRTIWWPLAINSRAGLRAEGRRARATDRLLIALFLTLEFVAVVVLRFGIDGLAAKPVAEAIIGFAVALCISFTTFAWLMGGIAFRRHIHPSVVWYSAVSERTFHRSQGTLGAELILREPFTFARMSRALRECQLYDYATHQWLTFDGRPTTAPRIVRVPSYESGRESDAGLRDPTRM